MNLAVPILVAVVTAGLIPKSFSVHNENPGIRLRVTNKGLQYADELGVIVLKKRLRQDGLDDIHKKQRGLEYRVYNIRNKGVYIQSSSLKTSPGVGVVLKANGVNLDFSGDLKYKKKLGWFYVRDTTSFSLNARGIGFSLTAQLGADSNGRPIISTTNCKARVDDLSIRFHGGASWLYNLFTGYIEKKLKERLEKLICSAGQRLVDEKAAKSLATFPVQKKISQYALIDYSLLENPEITLHHMDLILKLRSHPPFYPWENALAHGDMRGSNFLCVTDLPKVKLPSGNFHGYVKKTKELPMTVPEGEFRSLKSPRPAPLSPEVLPDMEEVDKMMYIWLTDYVYNTASLVYHDAGAFTTIIKPPDTPKESSFQLNTRSFKGFLPKLFELHPDRPVFVKLYTTEAPVFASTSAGINLTVVGNIEVYVRAKNGSSLYALTLGLNAGISGSLGVRSGNLTLHADSFRVKVHDVRSAIGDIKLNVYIFQWFLDGFVRSKGFLDQINSYGERGFPLPSLDKMELKDTVVTSGKGFTLIKTNLKQSQRK